MSKQIKQARALFQSKQNANAISILDDVIEDKPENLAALLLRAACYQQLQEYDKSVADLIKALEIDVHNLNVWRGLMRSYQEQKCLPAYFNASVECLALYANDSQGRYRSEDAVSLFKTLVKTISQESKSNKMYSATMQQQRQQDNDLFEKLLLLQIPFDLENNPKRGAIYEMLRSQGLVKSDATSSLISLRSAKLKTELSAIQARQKQSLNYKPENALSDKLEAMSKSHLDQLLRVSIAADDSDDARRVLEANLLGFLVDKLKLLVERNKKTFTTELRSEIRDLSDQMAMFEPAKPLAFELTWDWDMPSLALPRHQKIKKSKKQGNKQKRKEKNSKKADKQETEYNKESQEGQESLEIVPSEELSEVNLDSKQFETYIQLFPKEPLAAVLKSLMDDIQTAQKKNTACSHYSGSCVFGYLLCAEYFVNSRIYELAIDCAHHGLDAAKERSHVFGMDMNHAVLQFNLYMAISYTYFQAPKNFSLASEMYEIVLSSEPQNVQALTGKGMILSQEGKHDEAIEVLQDVVAANPLNSSALSELSWLLGQRGLIEEAIDGLQRCLKLGNTPSQNAEIHCRIGRILWDNNQRNQDCFNSFLAALKVSPTYASAFTYVGLFYELVLKDAQRAQRSYYRALELDSGELIAGERLATDFAQHSQWDLVEIVASTVLMSSKMHGNKDIDWPYRAMGIVSLNRLKYNDAVKYFQKCLRSRMDDVQAWVGLGEAYIHSGRYSSAEKALCRALKCDPENFSAHYVLSLAQREMLDFPASAASLQTAIKCATVGSAPLSWALTDNCLRAAGYLRAKSELNAAKTELVRAFSAVVASAELDISGSIWGLAAEGCLQLVSLGFTKLNDVKNDKIQKYISQLSQEDDLVAVAEEFASTYIKVSQTQPKPVKVAALSMGARTAMKSNDISLAVERYQAAIVLEPRNEELWVGYGVCLQDVSLEVAQHCFIRALSINGRNAQTWLNLSGLYLSADDDELAMEAADRALSLEPDLYRAWIVQALAETKLATQPALHIYRTLEHAYLLSDNDDLANLAFAFKEYELRHENPSSASLGALDKLLAVDPTADDARLIMALLLERRGDFEDALNHYRILGSWAHACRAQLALHQYTAVLESAERILGQNVHAAAKLSALITSALAHFFLNDYDSALETFMEILDHSDGGEDVLRMLIEVLYANHTPEALQAAQEQLFMSIEENGATLQVTLLLGAFGLLTGDKTVADAARDELRTLITPNLDGKSLAQACQILQLLDPQDNTFQRAVFQWPNDYHLWRHTDKDMALVVAESGAAAGTTSTADLSQALREAGGMTNEQRAQFLDPTYHMNYLSH